MLIEVVYKLEVFGLVGIVILIVVVLLKFIMVILWKDWGVVFIEMI